MCKAHYLETFINKWWFSIIMVKKKVVKKGTISKKVVKSLNVKFDDVFRDRLQGYAMQGVDY